MVCDLKANSDYLGVQPPTGQTNNHVIGRYLRYLTKFPEIERAPRNFYKGAQNVTFLWRVMQPSCQSKELTSQNQSRVMEEFEPAGDPMVAGFTGLRNDRDINEAFKWGVARTATTFR